MFFLLFIVLVVIWIVIASLHLLVARQWPWQHPLPSRAHSAMLRVLMEVRASMHLLFLVTSVLVLAEATLYLFKNGYTTPSLLVIILAFGAYALVSGQEVQQRVLGLAVGVSAKWGTSLGFIRTFLRAMQPFATRLFKEVPLYKDRQELHRFVRHHHQAHRVLSSSEHRQLENLLRIETETIANYVIALKEAVMVRADDMVGPLLLTELHDSSLGAVPVYNKRRANIVGILDQGVAVSHAKATTKVASLMDERIVFLPHNATLQQALQVFVETSSSLSVIIDENNTPIGVLYIVDVVRELFGRIEETNENTDA